MFSMNFEFFIEKMTIVECNQLVVHTCTVCMLLMFTVTTTIQSACTHDIRVYVLQVLGDLLRVRTLVRQHTAKHDESRTQEYLYAAARGDTSQIQQVYL